MPMVGAHLGRLRDPKSRLPALTEDHLSQSWVLAVELIAAAHTPLTQIYALNESDTGPKKLHGSRRDPDRLGAEATESHEPKRRGGNNQLY